MKFEIKDIRLKSTLEGGGGRFNFRFKYEKRWMHLVCHLKTKEYIRDVLLAKGPPKEVQAEAGVRVCVYVCQGQGGGPPLQTSDVRDPINSCIQQQIPVQIERR